jgi:hypothetical protein
VWFIYYYDTHTQSWWSTFRVGLVQTKCTLYKCSATWFGKFFSDLASALKNSIPSPVRTEIIYWFAKEKHFVMLVWRQSPSIPFIIIYYTLSSSLSYTTAKHSAAYHHSLCDWVFLNTTSTWLDQVDLLSSTTPKYLYSETISKSSPLITTGCTMSFFFRKHKNHFLGLTCIQNQKFSITHVTKSSLHCGTSSNHHPEYTQQQGSHQKMSEDDMICL